jgi:molybdopterin converting factor subunit 1
MVVSRGMSFMNKVKLLFFATLRDRAGTKSVDMEIPHGTTVRELKDRIGQEFPALRASLPTVLVAVNREYAGLEAILPDGADVALFPPVSGG